MPAANPGVPDYVAWGWLVTAIGWLIAIGWNFFNWRHTNNIALDVRSKNFALEQWKSVKIPIETANGDFRAAVTELRWVEAANLEDMKIACAASLKTMILKQDLLAQCLRAADKDSYIDDEHWEPLANGKLYGNETSWDLLMALSDKIALADDLAKIKESISESRKYANDIFDGVNTRVRLETIRHDPAVKH